MPRAVTPAGVRAGEPGALAGLIELRGSAVLAYACAILAPEAALEAAAHAMARFRSHVVGATDVRSLSPDAIVLRAVRESSAERVRHPAASDGTLRRLTRRDGGACELAPRLIAARANHDLSHQDEVRLDQHLASCPGCRALRERFRDGERAYVETAGNRLREGDARALLLALAGAGPLAAATPEAVAAEALDLLPPEVVTRPGAFGGSAAPAPQPERARAQSGPPVSASAPEAPAAPVPPEPDNSEAPGLDADAARNGPSATTPGRVSFGRRTIVIRSGMHTSGPATPEAAHPSEAIVPPDAPEQAGAAEEPPPPDKADDWPSAETGEPNEPAADDWPPPQAPERPVPAADDWPPAQAPERPVPAADDWPPAQARERPAPAPEEPAPAPEEPAPAPEEPAPAPEAASAPEESASEAGDTRLVPALDGGPGAPPDAGTLARIIPGVLIVMAIGIALLVAGIVGIDSTPATTDDIDPPSLREPADELGTTGTLRAPAAPGAEAAPNAD